MSKLLKENKRQWIEVLVWAIVTLFLVIVRVIYYANSHGLTSPWMSNAYAFPLVRFLLALGVALFKKNEDDYGRLFFNGGVASLTIYSLLMGIYDMASNYNTSTPVFLYVGIGLLAVGAGFILFHLFKKKKNVTLPQE